MKRSILLILLFWTTQLFAQEALWWKTPTTSPEIREDHKVTFRLKSFQAKQVEVVGDFLPDGKLAMRKLPPDMWEATTPYPLRPDLYNYAFVMDGVRITDPSNVYVARDVVTINNYFIVDGPGSGCYQERDVPHGTVSKIWYPCDQLQKMRRATVYTPAHYSETNNTTRYPVLYLLHGMGGDEEAWITLGRVAQIMDNLIAQGRAKPMIVVMPNGNMDQVAAPGYGPDGNVVPTIELPRTMDGTYEQSFPNLIRFIDRTYRTIPRKNSRAIAGLSMGGFQAMMVSKEYPDLFDYVGLFSALIRKDAAGVSPVYDRFHDKLRTQFAKRPALYWIAIGKEDFLYEANVEFCQLLDRNRHRHEFIETEGGHTWSNWRHYLKEFAQKVFR